MEIVNQQFVKRSERIHAKLNVIFKNKLHSISDLMNKINNCYVFRDKINYFIEIFQIILLDLNNFINEFYTNNFLLIVFEKGSKIKDILNTLIELENKTDLKYIYNKFNKIFIIYTNIISHHFLKHLHNININKNNNKNNKNIMEECPICLENLKSCNKIKTYCNHLFHTICLFKHLIKYNSCPLCRVKIVLII